MMAHKENIQEILKGCGKGCPNKIPKHDNSIWLCVDCEIKKEFYLKAVKVELEFLKPLFEYMKKDELIRQEDIEEQIKICEEAIKLGEKA